MNFRYYLCTEYTSIPDYLTNLQSVPTADGGAAIYRKTPKMPKRYQLNRNMIEINLHVANSNRTSAIIEADSLVLECSMYMKTKNKTKKKKKKTSGDMNERKSLKGENINASIINRLISDPMKQARHEFPSGASY